LIRATELGKETIPLILEAVSDQLLPLQLAGLQYVHMSAGVSDALPAILRGLGLGPSSVTIRDDPFARDGRLVTAIAEQLHYAAGFTDALNMVQLLQSIGLACCETEGGYSDIPLDGSIGLCGGRREKIMACRRCAPTSDHDGRNTHEARHIDQRLGSEDKIDAWFEADTGRT
jgi:hypothetical protein